MPVRIIVTHVKPPIPRRDWDWCAYVEGQEEAGGYGWGRTMVQALVDLTEMLCDEESLAAHAVHREEPQWRD